MVDRAPEQLVGGAVQLRRWRLADLPLLVAAVAQSLEHLQPWMPWAQEPPGEDQEKYVVASIEKFDRGEEFNYAILRTDGAELVGGCGLHRRTAAQDALEIGYWVCQQHTRHGYASAAVTALTQAAFALPGIRRVEVHCDKANVPSIGVPKKLGFRLDRQVQRTASAPAEIGTELIWILEKI